LAFSEQIERVTGGFITFDRTGINSIARKYRDGDREIHLVGMMHIGEGDAYREIFSSFAGHSTLILAEGVSDEGLRLNNHDFYDVVADQMGLNVQPRFEDLRDAMPINESDVPWPDIRNADVDTEVFSEETIALMNAAGEIYRGAGIRRTLNRFQERYGDRGSEVSEIVLRDLIENRNTHLLEEMRRVLDDYHRIIVPWGALHLPGIEQAILDWGFEPAGSSQRQLAGYTTVLQVLLSN
jgi:hypothetical protein